MKRMYVIMLGVAVLSAAIQTKAIAPAQATGNVCTLASVAGDWDFSYSGVAITPQGQLPVAAVGKFSTDAAGNMTGDEINNLAGAAAYQTISGKITMSDNCAGKLVANVYQAGTLVRTSYIHLQYADQSNHFVATFEKLALPGGGSLPIVINITGERITAER